MRSIRRAGLSTPFFTQHFFWKYQHFLNIFCVNSPLVLRKERREERSALAYLPCWPSCVGVRHRGAGRACAQGCSPSPGRGRCAGTCARAAACCRPARLAPGSRTARSFGRRSRRATWRGGLARTPPPPLARPSRARALRVPPVCRLGLLLFAPLPRQRNHTLSGRLKLC